MKHLPIEIRQIATRNVEGEVARYSVKAEGYPRSYIPVYSWDVIPATGIDALVAMRYAHLQNIPVYYVAFIAIHVEEGIVRVHLGIEPDGEGMIPVTNKNARWEIQPILNHNAAIRQPMIDAYIADLLAA